MADWDCPSSVDSLPVRIGPRWKDDQHAEGFPLEFRRDVVAVARKGEAPLSQIAKDFGISESCLHRWLRLADIDDGVRAGVTSGESAELRELRKQNRTLVLRIQISARSLNIASATQAATPGLGSSSARTSPRWRARSGCPPGAALIAFRGMSAQPVHEPDPDDPVEILQGLPARFHDQFLAEYYAAAAAAAQQVGGYRKLHDLLRLWRLTAAAYSDPGFGERLGAVREAVRTGSLEGSVPIEEIVPGWHSRS